MERRATWRNLMHHGSKASFPLSNNRDFLYKNHPWSDWSMLSDVSLKIGAQQSMTYLWLLNCAVWFLNTKFLNTLQDLLQAEHFDKLINLFVSSSHTGNNLQSIQKLLYSTRSTYVHLISVALLKCPYCHSMNIHEINKVLAALAYHNTYPIGFSHGMLNYCDWKGVQALLHLMLLLWTTIVLRAFVICLLLCLLGI